MSSVLYRAATILPGQGIRFAPGGLLVSQGTVLAVGEFESLRRDHPTVPVLDLDRVMVLPGLVNAHTHLSITGLTAVQDLEDPFVSWLGSVASQARSLDVAAVEAAVTDGIQQSLDAGTTLVGEVTTRPEGAEVLRGSGLHARIYCEFLGVSQARALQRFEDACDLARDVESWKATDCRPGLSPHAPYSVWPTLWNEAAAVSRVEDWRWSSHILEPAHEREFMATGTGALRDYLERLGVWDGTFPVPGLDPISLLHAQNALGPQMLLVHGVHLEAPDSRRLAESGTEVCLCPRSNAWLGLPPAPVMALLESGIAPCLGTDGLPSNHDLGLWGEMRAIRELAPTIPAAQILDMATVHGARALGFSDCLGDLHPGKLARFLAVDADPSDLKDPEEALVHEGSQRSRVRFGW